MVASIIRTIVAQPDRQHIQKQFREVTTMLGRSHPKVAAMLTDAEPDLLAFAGFPCRHWRWIWSTNPPERVNKEVKRRTDVVGVCPNPAALLRLARSVLIEQHDEREASERRYFSTASMLELATMNNPADTLHEAVILPELAA
jgi:transposase-like protein